MVVSLFCGIIVFINACLFSTGKVLQAIHLSKTDVNVHHQLYYHHQVVMYIIMPSLEIIKFYFQHRIFTSITILEILLITRDVSSIRFFIQGKMHSQRC
jgi:hypothetical protein